VGAGGFAGRGQGHPGDVLTPERDDPSKEPEELDSLIDEFGDRSGPDPAREPDFEPEPEEVEIKPGDEPDPDAP
jgi:hypothetical protein